uniref:Uncharacterized protein n=1 Tax=Glossina brevipalpis TaxID=37001 RepID=A0A1A9WX60_9MUSC
MFSEDRSVISFMGLITTKSLASGIFAINLRIQNFCSLQTSKSEFYQQHNQQLYNEILFEPMVKVLRLHDLKDEYKIGLAVTIFVFYMTLALGHYILPDNSNSLLLDTTSLTKLKGQLKALPVHFNNFLIMTSTNITMSIIPNSAHGGCIYNSSSSSKLGVELFSFNSRNILPNK